MKRIFLIAAFAFFGMAGYSQTFMQMTAIESVVPGGLGRSRLITQSSDGKYEEIKMENFFSLVGINFENIRFNDKVIADKIASYSKEGWKLIQVTPGVYSSSNEGGVGIFITRYLFQKD